APSSTWFTSKEARPSYARPARWAFPPLMGGEFFSPRARARSKLGPESPRHWRPCAKLSRNERAERCRQPPRRVHLGCGGLRRGLARALGIGQARDSRRARAGPQAVAGLGTTDRLGAGVRRLWLRAR